MGIGLVLTLIFLVLQLCGVIVWSWWFVFLPLIIGAVIKVVLLILLFVGLVAVYDKKVVAEKKPKRK